MRLKNIALLTLALLAWTLTGSAQTVRDLWREPLENGVAAIVEDQVITYEDLRREMAPLIPQLRAESTNQVEFAEKMEQLYRDSLQSLVDSALIVKAFEEKEMRIPQSLIENEFDKILIEDFDNDRIKFHEHLQTQGQTAREFREKLRQRIIIGYMRNEMAKSKSEVSPEKIRDYYQKNKIYFYQDEGVHLRLIMLRAKGGENADAVRERARETMSRLRAGESFEEVAMDASQDSRRGKGGDWGWIKRGDLRDELSEAAFDLEKGAYSEPLEVGGQYFILYAEDKREEGIQPLEEVRENIEKIILGQISRQAQDRWLERLRKDAYIKYN